MKKLLTGALLMLSYCFIGHQQEISAQVTTDSVDYLIITSSSLFDSFEDIVLWKNKKGVRTVLLNLDDIYGNYSGSTNQLKIKNCIKDYYDNYHLKFVMLGGDDSVVPSQTCYVRFESRISYPPTDLFYMCLNNPLDWNGDGDSLIGENTDGCDLEPQISLTRLPVRTSNDVAAFTTKLLRYEGNPSRSNYVRRMLFVGKDDTEHSQSISSIYTSRFIYNHYIHPYWNGGTNTYNWLFDLYCNIPNISYTPSTLTSQLNSGYHFVDFNGHANYHIWGTGTTPFTTTNASNLSNGNSSIFIVSGCFSNGFDDDTACLSEALLRNPNGGAIAYFGSTREVDTPSDTTEFHRLNTMMYHAKFYDWIFNEGAEYNDYCYGKVISEIKKDIANHPHTNSYGESRRWHLFTTCAMGDAEMPIYTDNPTDFTNVSVSKSGTSVTVNTGGISGCRIALTSTDKGETYFDVADGVSSYTFTNVNCPFYVAVTKHNYVPYIDDTYQFLGTKIMGNAFIGSSSTYYVDNLPAGMTVEWSLSSTANCQLTNNSPATNQCTVTSNTSNYSVTLTATIKKDGVVQITKSRLLTGGSSFTGTYEQSSCSDYGVTTPGISQTAIPGSRTMFVYQGCVVTLKSEYFRYKELDTYGPYSNVHFLGNNQIRLALNSLNVSQPLVLSIYDTNCPDEGIQLTFYAIPTSNLNGNYSLDISPMGGKSYEVNLIKNELLSEECGSEETSSENTNANKNDDEEDSWIVEVYNVRSGRKIVHEELTDRKYHLNATGWESGMYVVRAVVGEEVLVGKISVK